MGLRELREKQFAFGTGVSKKYALTAPHYIYRIVFRSHDIPKPTALALVSGVAIQLARDLRADCAWSLLE
jgi:hypothetical protein